MNTRTKILALAAIAVLLGGCAVASVGSAVVDVASTVVSTTADVAGAAVHTVTGSSDKDVDKDKD
jgi:outer membrane lipoprotein-sorting protein